MHPGVTPEGQYEEFKGQIIVVDIATINGKTEDFEGRTWLENHCRDRQPVGWALEWQPDRKQDSDNPVVLMQFADDKIALLLRTHLTKNWLPTSVRKALSSDYFVKVGVGSQNRTKMKSTFDFSPAGTVDLVDLARKKGIATENLKSLTSHFGLRMRKDSRIARSNWAAPELTHEQIQYAAEDAFFSYWIYDKLQTLSDQAPEDPEGAAILNQGVLELQPGWEDQGVIRKHDGLWCTMCDKGPMLAPMVMVSHLESKTHQKKLEQKCGLSAACDNIPLELSDEYRMKGISSDGLKVGEYKCFICNAGPFNNLNTIDAHLASKRHRKNTGLPLERELDSPLKNTGLPLERESDSPFSEVSTTASPLENQAIQKGQFVVVQIEISDPPCGWDAANYLLPLAVGEIIEVEHVEDDYFWGRAGGRVGWAPISAVALLEWQDVAPEVAADTSAGITEGSSARVISRVSAPTNYDPSTFLLLDIGTVMEVLYVDGEWLWGKSGNREGWFPTLAAEVTRQS